MITPPKATRVFGFLIVFLSIIVAAVGFFLVRDDIDEIARAGEENVLWNVLQVEIEMLRFKLVLAEFSNSEGKTSVADINHRFDILWSRVTLFQQGDVGLRVAEYDLDTRIFERLLETLKDSEVAVTSLRPTDQILAKNLLKDFAHYTVDLRNLSRRVLHGQEAKQAANRFGLKGSANILGVLSAIAVLASVLMIIVFARDTRRYRELAEENQILLDAAKKSGREKLQFLTMMSHELRTPMNGVLGMLGLINQKSLSESQRRLVEMAKRSGNQVRGLLSEIQDFAALQGDQLKLENKPYEPSRLLLSLKKCIEPMAIREGIVFTTNLDVSCPARVMGDVNRMRQALTHLTNYLIETAGTNEIHLEIRYESGDLISTISFDYGLAGEEWEPELIMGDLDRSGDKFVSAALGPAVARGLISKMDGKTKLSNPSDDRIAVLVFVPSAELVVSKLLVKIVTRSSALEAICKAALRSTKVMFLNGETKDLPHVVLIQAGDEKETELVKQYGKAYPQAMLVALGRPNFPDAFDDILEVPLDIQSIQRSKFMRLAS